MIIFYPHQNNSIPFHESNKIDIPKFNYFLRFFIDVTLSILGNFKLDVTLLFWVITSLYLSPITCSHGALLFFILSISLHSKNYLGVRDLKSVTSNKKRRKYTIYIHKSEFRKKQKKKNRKENRQKITK